MGLKLTTGKFMEGWCMKVDGGSDSIELFVRLNGAGARSIGS